jgi:hypothetical protein
MYLVASKYVDYYTSACLVYNDFMNDFPPFIPHSLTDGQKLDKILLELDLIQQEINNMTVTLAQLDAAIAAENAQLTSLDSGLQALTAQTTQLVTDVAALVAKVNAGADFTNELNAVTAGAALASDSATQLSDSVASVTSADASATSG